ncbi:MAG: phage terminase large subunit [Paracoccaceae bacterium]
MKTLHLVDQWDPDRDLIEDASTGRPLFDELFLDDRRYDRIRADKNKEIRFSAACAPVEEGKVLLPSDAPWLTSFKRELQGFPRGRNDDQVDSVSQFLNWSKGNGFWRALPHNDPLRLERRARNRIRVRR